ncbi:MAG: ABC transporter ATP-binding protein [Phycisphaerae bacterium]
MAPSPTATGIRIHDLCKSFAVSGGKNTPAAVANINLAIEPGELFFLLGPSGCGKTTLLRMIAGFIEPTSGRVEFVHGGTANDVTHLPPEQRNTGMVFQSYALWPHMTVAQNVAFGLDVRKIEGNEKTQRVKEALDAVQMSEYSERKPNQLSGGQQQRVALARAVVVRPSVLLLDEPLSNLDAKLRVELRSEIRRLCKRFGMTTLYVTHDQKEALSMADRIAILRRGEVVQVGGAQELYRRPRTSFVASFLGETNFLRCQPSTVGATTTLRTPMLDWSTSSPTNGRTGELTISIRPEAIRLDAATNRFNATITDRIYLGESLQLKLLVGETPLTMSIPHPPEQGLHEGETVSVGVASEDVVLVDD